MISFVLHPAGWRCAAILAALLVCGSARDGLAQARAFDADTGTRGLSWAWGQSWRPGFPGWGKTTSDIAFVAFHPQMGWFVTTRLELFGEGTLFFYHRPRPAVAAGLLPLAGRYHFRIDRAWTPYVTAGAGLILVPLDVPEIDRLFNFQVVFGAGVRWARQHGPGLILEVRNHHISNAGTAGENLGVNAATLVAGVQWILR
jgi:lipid A 3-O-deacylase